MVRIQQFPFPSFQTEDGKFLSALQLLTGCGWAAKFPGHPRTQHPNRSAVVLPLAHHGLSNVDIPSFLFDFPNLSCAFQRPQCPVCSVEHWEGLYLARGLWPGPVRDFCPAVGDVRPHAVNCHTSGHGKGNHCFSLPPGPVPPSPSKPLALPFWNPRYSFS